MSSFFSVTFYCIIALLHYCCIRANMCRSSLAFAFVSAKTSKAHPTQGERKEKNNKHVTFYYLAPLIEAQNRTKIFVQLFYREKVNDFFSSPIIWQIHFIIKYRRKNGFHNESECITKK